MDSLKSNPRLQPIFRNLFPIAGLIIASILSAVVGVAPWASFGAPLVVFLLFGGAAFVFILLDSAREERPFSARLFLVSIVVLALAALIYNLVLRGSWLDDARGYDRAAAALANAWRQNIPVDLGPLPWLADDMFTRLVASFYFVLGPSPIAVIVFNIVLGGTSVYLVYRIAHLLLGPVTARLAGWLAVLYSGFWIFGLMPLKDAFGFFLVALFFYALYRLWNTILQPGRLAVQVGRAIFWIVLLIGAWRATNALRDYVGQVMLLGACALVPIWLWRFRSRRLSAALIAVVVVAVILLWPRISAFPLPAVNLESNSTMFQFVEVPQTGTIGGMATWAAANPLAFGKYLLLAAGSTAIAPFAWILPLGGAGSPAFSAYTVGLPGMWLWYFCLPFAVLGLVSAWKRSKGEVLPLALFAVVLFLVFAILIPRETRHRDIVMPMLLILSAEGLVFHRSLWPLGLIFWAPLVLFMAWKIGVLLPAAVLLAVLAVLLGGGYLILRRRAARNPTGDEP